MSKRKHNDDDTPEPIPPLIEITDVINEARMNKMPLDTMVRVWLEDRTKMLTFNYIENGNGILVRSHRILGGFSTTTPVFIEISNTHSIIIK